MDEQSPSYNPVTLQLLPLDTMEDDTEQDNQEVRQLQILQAEKDEEMERQLQARAEQEEADDNHKKKFWMRQQQTYSDHMGKLGRQAENVLTRQEDIYRKGTVQTTAASASTIKDYDDNTKENESYDNDKKQQHRQHKLNNKYCNEFQKKHNSHLQRQRQSLRVQRRWKQYKVEILPTHRCGERSTSRSSRKSTTRRRKGLQSTCSTSELPTNTRTKATWNNVDNITKERRQEMYDIMEDNSVKENTLWEAILQHYGDVENFKGWKDAQDE
eukprot:6467025-Amphidinium_carterae.1